VARPALLGLFHRGFESASAIARDESHSPQETGSEAEHFSPNENLEAWDVALLRKAHHSIDAAMFAFTDRRLVAVLKEMAREGVQIRLYRDQEQFENEQHHATFREPSTTQMFAGQGSIHIRVKRGSLRDLMHSKSILVDGEPLRAGSANWSRSALQSQDNDWFLIRSRSMISAFATKFEEMWNRPSNLIIQ
jgi:phosphatidylserine/phosphatidylglycerophosphate/cardiolipin synthase-like enzyme